ncbi:VPLPA-CTERM sorting domain-containing protein [Rhodobacterales bacterium HKCCE3408]|nr:VPLPA-CTERM sorting domain-containing protein [Rhodobacterales bacterium HKCCE3408]
MFRHFAAALLAAMPFAVSASTMSNTVVFGDSLSDPGVFGAPFTNGDPWTTQLGLDLASGRNFAVGGARAIPNPTLSDFAEQRMAFAGSTPSLSPTTRVVAWFGGNDLLNISDPRLAPVVVGTALGSIAAGVLELNAVYGISRFVLPGLPDLGQVPAGASVPGATLLSQQWNAGLQQTAALLETFGLKVRYADVAGEFQSILADPAFTNTTGHCFQGAISCDGYVFWDPVHPTEAVHARIAEVISAEIAALPLPAGAWLMIAGLGGLTLVARRRTVAA